MKLFLKGPGESSFKIVPQEYLFHDVNRDPPAGAIVPESWEAPLAVDPEKGNTGKGEAVKGEINKGEAQAKSPMKIAFKKNPKLQDFLGTWTGKWDDTWDVRFTLSQKGNTVWVVYEWKEKVEGKYDVLTSVGVLEGDVLKIGNTIQIWLDSTNPNKAQAEGRFHVTRRANLIRKK